MHCYYGADCLRGKPRSYFIYWLENENITKTNACVVLNFGETKPFKRIPIVLITPPDSPLSKTWKGQPVTFLSCHCAALTCCKVVRTLRILTMLSIAALTLILLTSAISKDEKTTKRVLLAQTRCQLFILWLSEFLRKSLRFCRQLFGVCCLNLFCANVL